MNEPKDSPRKQASVLRRAVLSLVFGGLIAIVTLFAGLQQANREASLRQVVYRQRLTIHQLMVIRNDILSAQSTTHRLPDLKEFAIKGYLDGWGNPIDYSVDGTRFQLFSYGADGQPGGTGLAADLTADSKPVPSSYRLTMGDFLALPDTSNMVLAGIGTGLLSALVCLFVTKPPQPERPHRLPVALRLVLIFANAVFLGWIISTLNAPTSH